MARECPGRTAFSKTEFLQHGGLHSTGFMIDHRQPQYMSPTQAEHDEDL